MTSKLFAFQNFRATSRILNTRAAPAAATGQEIVVETFANSTTWTCPTGVTSVEYLVVAGGGGGGCSVGYTEGTGGGGAGGFRTGTGYAVTAGNTYTITVAAGGNGTS